MPTKPRALGAGLVALDVIVPDAEQPEKKLVQAGGSCGNVMAILAYFGWNSAPIARLDETKNFEILCDDLEQWGVDMKWAQGEVTGSTPLILQVNHHPATQAARHKFHWRCLNCSGWYPRFKPFKKTFVPKIIEAETKVTAYYFDRAFPASIQLAKHLKEQGAVVVFEPNGVRDEAQFKAALEVAHVVKYSHERMAPHNDLLTELDVWLQIETMGRDGLRFLQRGSEWETLPAVEAPFIIDTAGAGDWCSAVLMNTCFRKGSKGLTKLIHKQVKDALRMGQAYAALNCAFAGARGTMFAVEEGIATRYAKALLEGTNPLARMKASEVERVAAEYCGSCEPQPVPPRLSPSQKVRR